MANITGGTPHNWLVIGWFTPDYRPLAERFAANLGTYGIPFHLYAKPKLGGGWDTSRKPSVALEAMQDHPSKTLVLMDVDCIVQGDISLVTNITGDVGITVLARNMRKGCKWQHWIAAECSSRVVVFRPTEGARAFLHRWVDQIDHGAVNHDEHSMVWAFLACPDVRFEYIDPIYSGREVSQRPDGIVVHQSAHSAERHKGRGSLRRFMRHIERRFLRTGRTSRDKTPLSHVLRGGIRQ